MRGLNFHVEGLKIEVGLTTEVGGSAPRPPHFNHCQQCSCGYAHWPNLLLVAFYNYILLTITRRHLLKRRVDERTRYSRNNLLIQAWYEASHWPQEWKDLFTSQKQQMISTKYPYSRFKVRYNETFPISLSCLRSYWFPYLFPSLILLFITDVTVEVWYSLTEVSIHAQRLLNTSIIRNVHSAAQDASQKC